MDYSLKFPTPLQMQQTNGNIRKEAKTDPFQSLAPLPQKVVVTLQNMPKQTAVPIELSNRPVNQLYQIPSSQTAIQKVSISNSGSQSIHKPTDFSDLLGDQLPSRTASPQPNVNRSFTPTLLSKTSVQQQQQFDLGTIQKFSNETTSQSTISSPQKYDVERLFKPVTDSTQMSLSGNQTPSLSIIYNETVSTVTTVPLKNNQSLSTADYTSSWGNLDFIDSNSSSTDPFDIDFLQKAGAKHIYETSNKNSDDNPLGILGKPIDDSRKTKAAETFQPLCEPQPSLKSDISAIFTGPGPAELNSGNTRKDEIISDSKITQIVSMGFDASLARLALEENNGNLSKAINDLLSQSNIPEEASTPRKQNKIIDNNSLVQRQIIGHENVIQTASAFGTNVFKNAKSLFDYGKKKVLEHMEGINSYGTSRSPDEHENYSEPDREKYAGFSDSENEGSYIIKNHDTANNTSFKVDSVERFDSNNKFNTKTHVPNAELNIQHNNFTTVHIDNKKPKSSSTVNDTINIASRENAQTTQVAMISSNFVAPKKIAVSATPVQLEQYALLKLNGNDAFRRGQFHEASEFYSSAMNILPPTHELQVTLLNNRASALLKIGEYKLCVEDCNRVQELELNNLKSLLRRANACEALEDWNAAIKDYQSLMILSPSPSVSQSLARCNQGLAQKFSRTSATSVVKKISGAPIL